MDLPEVGGISQTVFEMPGAPIGLAIDIEKGNDGKPLFSVTMGTGFNDLNHGTVNVELPRLTLQQFKALVDELNVILADCS